MENKSLKIGIYGLGLIGGSILKALYSLNKYYLVAVSKSSYEKAKDFADVSTSDISALAECDIVFVCSKMKDTKNILLKLEEIVPAATIVSDVCSIKGFLKGEYKFNYVSTHPMAGTEFSGFEHSFKELFIGAKWVIEKPNEIIETLIKELGAKPLIIKPDEHDEMAAQISHLPMLISMALFDSADEDAKILGASGFRDTTRLAMTNSDLAYDMLNFNKDNIEHAYKNFIEKYEKITKMSEVEFKDYVNKIATKRSNMYDRNGKNIL